MGWGGTERAFSKGAQVEALGSRAGWDPDHTGPRLPQGAWAVP